MPPPTSKALSKREMRWRLFAEAYIIDLNATNAAKAAGYNCSSDKAFQTQGSETLSNPIVQRHIQELMDERSKKTKITADVILGELLKIATSDLSEAYDENGQLLPIKQMPEGVRKAISSIDTYKDFTEGVEIGETSRIKFWDKNKSLELLGRHLKLFTDKVESQNQHLIEAAQQVASMSEEQLDQQIAIEAKKDKK